MLRNNVTRQEGGGGGGAQYSLSLPSRRLEAICENGAPHRDTRENTFHSNWCHPLQIKVILDAKTQDSGFQEQKFPAFPYWGGDFRGLFGQAFPLSTLACLRARPVYLRHHFIKNALPVSCLHNRILRETTLMLKIYQYIKKIYAIVTSKRLLRKHNRFHVTAAILTPSFVRVTKNFCQ